jgi:C-terminal processing protease CtpA/Prc
MKIIYKYKFWLAFVLVLHIIASINMGNTSSKTESERSVESSFLSEGDKTLVIDFVKKQRESSSKSVRVRIKSIGNFEKEQEAQKAQSAKCEDDSKNETYEGMGIVHSWEGVVKKVAEGYAADKAGIMVNDVILGFFEHSDPDRFVEGVELRGKSGTSVDVIVKRNGEIIRLTMTREKICYEQNTP